MASLTSQLSLFDTGNTETLQNAVVNQQQTIVALQGQIQNINGQVAAINGGLQGIGNLIRNDSVLEQTRLLEEKKREKLLNERNIRLGKEQQVEQRINKSLSESVKEIEPRLTTTFNGITENLKRLFSGFLIPGLIKFVSNAANLAIKALTGIQSFVFKSIGFIGNSLRFLRTGIGGIAGKVGTLITKIGDIAMKLVKSPIKAIANLFKGIPGLISGGAKGAAAAAGGAVAGTADNFLGALSGILKGAGKVVAPVAVAAAADQAITGGKGREAVGNTINSVVNLFGNNKPESKSESSSNNTSVQGEGSKNIFNTTNSSNKNINSQSFFSNPLNIDVGKTFNDTKTNITNVTSNLFGGGTGGGMDTDSAPQSATPSNVSKPSSQTPSSSSTPQTSAVDSLMNLMSGVPIIPPTTNSEKAKITSSPATSNPISAPPEPKPTIIYASNFSSPQRGQIPSKTGPLTDIPLIPSSNVDNFYSLYSQTHYNVVM